MRTIRNLVLLTTIAAACPAVAAAQSTSDLGQATLEELMSIRVTSAARTSQRAEDVAAALYVITRHEIRRSGLTRVPEILRLAPGVQVAQISASKWAISIRGFNEVFSNKLLVLVDGRSIYTRTFSGVLWDLLDMPVADIDRIEVIRGPGGVTWGANAVNGIINIITRPSTETAGLAVDLSAGTFARERVGVRYGGQLGSAAYRVYSQWSGFADATQVDGAVFEDGWRSLTSGFRTDWSRGADAVLAQGHFTTNQTRPGWLALTSFVPGAPLETTGASDGHEVSVLGRWTRTLTSGAVLQVQGYHTSTRRDEPILLVNERSSDLEAQHESRLGERHGLIVGGGFRHVDVSVDGSLTAQLGSYALNTVNMFVQDEIAVRRDLALTLGVKLERDTWSDWALIPSARVMWEASPGQRVWAHVSRAQRTPAISDRDFRFNLAVSEGPGLPIVIAVVGNSEYRREEFVQAEAGHRIRIGAKAALETTVFSGSYRGLPTQEPVAPVLELSPAPAHLLAAISLQNLMRARASGVELNAHWSPLPQWQLDGSYSFLHLTTDLDPASLDAEAALDDGNAPAHQWQVRTTVSPVSALQFSASLARSGRLERLDVPAHTRLDARAALRLTTRLTAAVVGQNLQSSQHQEFSASFLYLTSRMPRSARLDLRWEF